jgi:hypothetical protein
MLNCRPVPWVQINDRNYVPKNRVSEIGLGFPLPPHDIAKRWFIIGSICYFTHRLSLRCARLFA